MKHCNNVKAEKATFRRSINFSDFCVELYFDSSLFCLLNTKDHFSSLGRAVGLECVCLCLSRH